MCAPCMCVATCGMLDAGDDTCADNLWVWELRDHKKQLPKGNKKLAEVYRKRRKDVSACTHTCCDWHAAQV